ncbi:bZIP transcription factor 30-like [Miscanthus floridulus]|uniref:bZIP transcription factor 30-like n=1 Tax=Miscanthus floridulus TaxID=154761 RepID=UPI0034579544
MERQHKKPAANTAASSPASSGSSSSSRSIHGSMSSAFLGVSSSTHSQSQRRSSPSLCPPPAPAPLPSLLAFRGSAVTGGSASGSSSSQFHQISPSPGTAAKRRPRPSSRITHSLPSPFLSELSAIRRMGTNLFGDPNAQEIMTQRPLLHGQQEQEMTRSSSSLTMSHSHHRTPIPIGDFSGFPSASQQQEALTMRGLLGFAPPPFQQQQAQPSFSSLQPLPVGNFLQLAGSSSEQSMTGAAEGVGVGQTWEAMPTPASVHDKVNNGGSSSSSIPWKCHGSMPVYSWSEEQALQQLSDLVSLWSSTASSSCDQSMGSSVAGSCQGSADMPALANKFDMMSINSSSCSARPQMSLSYGSLSVENSTPVVSAVPKLIVGGMDRPGLLLRPPALGAGASSSMSRRGGTKEHFFSEADMEKINKDNRLKELVKTEPKRVRRILRNREYVARQKVQKANHMQDLQHRADALKMECTSLSAQVQSHQEMVDSLKTGNRELQIKLKGLNEQANLSQGH